MLLSANPTIDGVAPLPENGGQVTAAITKLDVTFSEDLQPAGVNNDASWELLSLGSPGPSDDEGVSLTSGGSYSGGTAVTLAVGQQPL